LGTSGLTDPDSVPELPDRPVSRLGDLRQLGNHRVGCGDSTSQADVAGVLAEAQPYLMVTDPPYGVEYDPSWRAHRNQSGDKLARGKVLNDDRADWQDANALFPGDVAYVWHGALHGEVVAADLAACGLQRRAQIIWAKQHFALSRGHYHWRRMLLVRGAGGAGHATGKAIAHRQQFGRLPTAILSATRSASRAGDTARRSRSNALHRALADQVADHHLCATVRPR
jgi:hypothetical protein